MYFIDDVNKRKYNKIERIDNLKWRYMILGYNIMRV
jgi:hypothetical protein